MSTVLARRSLVLGSACLVGSAALAVARRAASAAAPAYAGLEGRWAYRSFLNASDAAEDFARLGLASAIMEIVFYSQDAFMGSLTAPAYQLNVSGTASGERFTMRGTQGSPNTVGWHYEYSGWLPPRWSGAAEQVPTFVGTVLRVADHDNLRGGVSRGGLTYSIIGVKQPDRGR